MKNAKKPRFDIYLLTGSHLLVQEEGYWDSACSSDSPNPNGSSPQNCHSYTSDSPYSYNRTFDYEKPNNYLCDDGYHTGPSIPTLTVGPVRVVKRRTTANKKERRRTQSINSAYLSLREHIPNVPTDTKLSKIKTLRLAKTYISYLVGVLDGEQDPQIAFRPELVPSSRKINAERKALMKSEMQVIILNFLFLIFCSTFTL